MNQILICPACRQQTITCDQQGGSCSCGHRLGLEEGLLRYSPREALDSLPEVGARDKQASGYLEHIKFPIQIFRVKQFLRTLPVSANRLPALDLGCGPGPYTPLLLERGHHVVAVDFSAESLRINRQRCGVNAERALHVVADLNQLLLAPGCTEVLMMCDFLQHLGNATLRKQFLERAFGWLAPGGYFYLSFFNFNVVNQRKGDKQGAFAGGAIPYERSSLEEVLGFIPGNIAIDSIKPMNIFHSVPADRIAARLPFARRLARMMAISGRKIR